MKKLDLRGRLEAGAVWLFYHLLRSLPLDIASGLGGWIGRNIARHLPLNRRAFRNLERVWPDLPRTEQERIVAGMWDNLGRMVGEFPHIDEIEFGPNKRVAVEGAEYLHQLRDDGLPGLLFSAHLGNWELTGAGLTRMGLRAHPVYRAANNPRLEWLFQHRTYGVGLTLIPKGAKGAKMALGLLAKGEHVAMLIDQKMNDGIAVPFFGIEAMTAPALASFALKFNCPVVPGRIVRMGGAHFRLVLEAPIHFENTGNREQDIHRAMAQVNAKLEGWIREHPEQWLWLHRRWPN
ncbi:MAG TPA: lauroyl acyltransferase [Rhodospirillaceae bacterium]|nr:lauroyl acyltransferase [Rhodospirillaceae bacterium]